MIGVDQQGAVDRIKKLIPDYMVMGDTGGSMGDMEMPLPDNTLPMMTGQGPHGGVEMGGMFTVFKVREGLARNSYMAPGWSAAAGGTVAQGSRGTLAARAGSPAARGLQGAGRGP